MGTNPFDDDGNSVSLDDEQARAVYGRTERDGLAERGT